MGTFVRKDHDFKIIAIEGIDGSGKTMQWKLLKSKLEKLGKKVDTWSFPIYDSFFGKEVGKYLSADGVSAQDVDSKSMSLWYALDRFSKCNEYYAELEKNGEAPDYLLINRYTMSNIVYQSIREIDKGFDDNYDWVRDLEHGEFALPVPDLYLIMDVDPNFAQRNVDRKGEREYIDGRDVYEAEKGLLSRARKRYIDIAKKSENAEIIKCMDESGNMFSPEYISNNAFDIIIKKGIIKGAINGY